MSQRMWSIGLTGLGFGALAMAGGTVIRGDVGPLMAGYGFLVVLAALYLVVGLAIRERVWRRIGRPGAQMPRAGRLASRRVF